ncbi:unnamed protein product [Paramecium pentaurelia]|uniref:Uncharacterized protein n=1 Tax=Paramecium pentaurelia TaxID=43138 RepID=A0A8S1S2H3_9CILI|nr:unnamed protein product [Paramecium pentaurelia]
MRCQIYCFSLGQLDQTINLKIQNNLQQYLPQLHYNRRNPHFQITILHLKKNPIIQYYKNGNLLDIFRQIIKYLKFPKFIHLKLIFKQLGYNDKHIRTTLKLQESPQRYQESEGQYNQLCFSILSIQTLNRFPFQQSILQLFLNIQPPKQKSKSQLIMWLELKCFLNESSKVKTIQTSHNQF